MLLLRIVFTFAILLAAGPVYAECRSHYDDSGIDYVEYTRSRYTICHGPGRDHLRDRNLVRKWVDSAFQLGREKYQVRTFESDGHELKLTVYLPPVATAATRQGVVRFACCYNDRYGTLGNNGTTVQHAEVHYLTPSAWEPWCCHPLNPGKGEALGGLAQPPEYYHPHYVTHEVMHYFQHVCCREDARDRGYRVPSWITEGMAESDGYRHTSEWSRTEAVRRLGLKFVDDELGSVIWGRSLDLVRSLHVTDLYWAGGFVMNYLAETYGDDIHRELLLDDIGTVLERRHSSVTDLFVDLVVVARELLEDFDGTETYITAPRLNPTAAPPRAPTVCRHSVVETR